MHLCSPLISSVLSATVSGPTTSTRLFDDGVNLFFGGLLIPWSRLAFQTLLNPKENRRPLRHFVTHKNGRGRDFIYVTISSAKLTAMSVSQVSVNA